MFTNGCLIGVTSFLASSHPPGKCGANGLPLTPYSVRIAGRAEAIFGIRHPHLCRYVSVKRGHHERIFLAMEHYSDCIASVFFCSTPTPQSSAITVAPGASLPSSSLRAVEDSAAQLSVNSPQPSLPQEQRIAQAPKILFQLLQAAEYLHQAGLVLRNLSAENVRLDGQGNIKISNFGFNFIVENGSSVDFPVGEARYLSPERIAVGPMGPANPKEDVWAAALIVLECVCGCALGPVSGGSNRKLLTKYFQHIINFAEERRREEFQDSYLLGDQAQRDLFHLNRLLEFSGAGGGMDLKEIPSQLTSVLALCLHPVVTHRPTAAEALSHPIFEHLHGQCENGAIQGLKCFSLPSFKNVPETAEEIALLAQTYARPEKENKGSTSNANATPNALFLSKVSHDTSYQQSHSSPPIPSSSPSKQTIKPEATSASHNESFEAMGSSSFSSSSHTTASMVEASPMTSAFVLPETSNLSPTESLIIMSVASLHNPLLGMAADEAYHLWTLAGGDVEVDMVRRGLVVSEPPICTIPPLVRKVADARLPRPHGAALMPVSRLDLDSLVRRLASARLNLFPELLPLGDGELPATYNLEASGLPLLIRERDLDYQVQRLVVMRRLLRGLPYTKEFVKREAKVDVPPLYRGAIWRVLLDVGAEAEASYAEIDKDVDTSTDHQLDLDIPRCHQYDGILSSPTGHAKLREVLKAWVVTRKELTYWQGLDSLCAPFVRLNFNELHYAFACFNAFINRYLTNFFLKDNAEVINEYLVVYQHLLAFHDPALFNHVNSIGFIPELYAISWFLTCFAHVFPLDKIYHLWDKLLLGDSRMPICVGVAILTLLRAEILESDFNACILRFSDVPDVDVEVCAQRAEDICRATPPSILARQKSTPLSEQIPCPSIEKRKQFKSPILTMPDFLVLYGGGNGGRGESIDLLLGGLGSSIGGSSGGESEVLVIDTRAPHEYASLRLEHSVCNLHADEAFLDDGSMKPDALEELRKVYDRVRSRHVCVVIAWHRISIVERVSSQLVSAGLARVCVLEGGVLALRDNGLLRLKRQRNSSEDVL